jgi:ribosomal protein L40E
MINIYYKMSDICITCYAKISVNISGDEIETCHKCLVYNYDISQIDKLNILLEDYIFDKGVCEQCLYNCETVTVSLCYEHERKEKIKIEK